MSFACESCFCFFIHFMTISLVFMVYFEWRLCALSCTVWSVAKLTSLLCSFCMVFLSYGTHGVIKSKNSPRIIGRCAILLIIYDQTREITLFCVEIVSRCDITFVSYVCFTAMLTIVFKIQSDVNQIRYQVTISFEFDMWSSDLVRICAEYYL
jgi:hypothetical protein